MSPLPEKLTLPDGDLLFWRRIDLGAPDGALLAALVEETPWREEQVTLSRRVYKQPRLLAWYGDEGCTYTYSGTLLVPLPWTPTLQALKSRVEGVTGHVFNSVLLNFYRDNRDSMGFHADDEPELGERPAIASLSLGDTRTLVFKHRRRALPDVKLPLTSGSLLLMRGETQTNWKHGIPRRTRACGLRVNLTFRLVAH